MLFRVLDSKPSHHHTRRLGMGSIYTGRLWPNSGCPPPFLPLPQSKSPRPTNARVREAARGADRRRTASPGPLRAIGPLQSLVTSSCACATTLKGRRPGAQEGEERHPRLQPLDGAPGGRRSGAEDCMRARGDLLDEGGEAALCPITSPTQPRHRPTGTCISRQARLWLGACARG